jgi:DDE family transposase
VVNDGGEILVCRFTSGNVEDRVPIPRQVRRLWSNLLGDKGYRSQPLSEQLEEQGMRLVTRLKGKVKNRLILEAGELLRKRSIMETVIDQMRTFPILSLPIIAARLALWSISFLA